MSVTDDLILSIVNKYFNIKSLEPKNLDREDFVEIHVSNLKDALEDAIEYGYKLCEQSRG